VSSYFFDLPTGYTVVALYAMSGIVFSLIRGPGKAEPQDAVGPEARAA